jgi:hypothetical protein
MNAGYRPFPMVFGDRKRGLPLGDANHRLAPRTLGEFQRWAIRRLYSVVAAKPENGNPFD